MLLTTIAQNSILAIVGILSDIVLPSKPDMVYLKDGDIVRNLETGAYGVIDGDCDDPYDFTGNPVTVAYVVIYRNAGNSSDHWHYHDMEFIQHGTNPKVDCAILNSDEV